ncbi:hypothetical protein ACFFX1_07510 [Dactylosporangium sucinum]|uniref:Uncharacterized protein n=1 Tax=Dactylosporangium sucinum TaxID=1424081 RepID=A0A917UBQ0_9ACTN|nr:hypothetical protein [Dactylosporangium sucinum]GGM69944.1 hypothetical protein GCM10007977_084600 [Dactylosporangium sucinum]
MQDWDDDGFADVHEDRAEPIAEEDPDTMLGTALDVDGQTEDGNPVAWSTSYNEYYDTVTGGTVEPK